MRGIFFHYHHLTRQAWRMFRSHAQPFKLALAALLVAILIGMTAAPSQARNDLPVVKLPPGTINVALLGIDKRPTKSFLNTDVIAIASINPDIPAVTLLSIPRDWPADIPGVGVQKINTAYGIGGINLFKQTILNNFGLKIDYYALVNFEGLVRAVDTLGGVDAIATCRLYHVFPRDPYYMGNPYVLAENYTDTFTGEVWKKGTRVPTTTIDIPKPGVYTLTGLEALAFVRARYGVPGGDVDRGRREQRIVRALFTKAKQVNAIPHFLELFNQFQEHVKTDIPIDKLLYFASIADRFDNLSIRSRFLDSGGANGAVLTLGEGTGGGTWESQVQQMLNVALNQRPNDGIPIEVWNGTNDPGFGSAAVDRLSELGFNVTSIKAADKLYAQTTVVDYTTTKKGSAIPLLQRTFNINKANIISEPNKEGPRYRVIIGPDFKTCYYDDSYVLTEKKPTEITDPSVQASVPATPTIAITPTPLPDIAAGALFTAPTGLIASVPLGDQVNLRAGPGVRYAIISTLSQEEWAQITGKNDAGDWLRVKYQGRTGWLATEFVRVSGDLEIAPVIGVAQQVEAVVQPGDYVNVRTGPSVDYNSIGMLTANQSALVIGKSADGKWWQVRMGVVTGWISADYVEIRGNPSTIPVVKP
jgi:anionic cell wall polymer biosynthesis LytR-Cps2A-Psr (LCP) family protein/uncharacterized protein YraI